MDSRSILRFSLDVGSLFRAVTMDGAYRATKYLSEKEVIKATRRHKIDKRDKSVEVVITAGRPNYKEREFIRQAKKAGEPFPVRKIQLKVK